MNRTPVFPTLLHRQTAGLISEFFVQQPAVDTILIVNSCARGKAVAHSDLDAAILVKPGTEKAEIKFLENGFRSFLQSQPVYLTYKKTHHFAQLHVDVIDGNFVSSVWDDGGGPDYFEIEIGNHIVHSAPLQNTGDYFKELQQKYLPYYSEDLRLQRLKMAREACAYDLDHIPFFIKRKLYFQAFDRLYKAFQQFLQALFIAYKTYPIAYNKWIREQVAEWLQSPDLYAQLPAIISIKKLESNEINDKAILLQNLLEEWCG